MKLYEAIAKLMQYKLENYTMDQEFEACDKIKELLKKYHPRQTGIGIYCDSEESNNQQIAFVGHFYTYNNSVDDRSSHVITLTLNPFKTHIWSTKINDVAEQYINNVFLPILQTEIIEEIQ